MNTTLQKVGVTTTILASFLEATSGSALGAAMFWLTLIYAAIVSGPQQSRADDDRRWM